MEEQGERANEPRTDRGAGGGCNKQGNEEEGVEETCKLKAFSCIGLMRV